MGRIAGTCYIKVDGQQLAVEGSVEIPLSKTNRESKIGSTGVAGYSETEIAPFVRLSVSGAYLVGEIAMNGSDGNVSLEFNGVKGHLQTN